MYYIVLYSMYYIVLYSMYYIVLYGLADRNGSFFLNIFNIIILSHIYICIYIYIYILYVYIYICYNHFGEPFIDVGDQFSSRKATLLLVESKYWLYILDIWWVNTDFSLNPQYHQKGVSLLGDATRLPLKNGENYDKPCWNMAKINHI